MTSADLIGPFWVESSRAWICDYLTTLTVTSADLKGLCWVESSSILSFNLWLPGSTDYDLCWPDRTMLSRILQSLNLWLPSNTKYDLCWPDMTMLSRILLSLNLWIPGNNQVSRDHLCWPDRTMLSRTSSAWICDYLATLIMTSADLIGPCWVESFLSLNLWLPCNTDNDLCWPDRTMMSRILLNPQLQLVTTWQQWLWPLLTW